MSDTPPIACTLDAGSHATRLADIRALLARALKNTRREGASLHLTFDATARADVEDMVRKEKSCCAFLDFQIAQRDGEIDVTITAPPAAADGADALFAPFAKPASKLSGLLARAGLSAGGTAALCAAGCALSLPLLGVAFCL